MDKRNIYFSIIISLTLCIGILLGNLYSKNANSKGNSPVLPENIDGYDKLSDVLNLLQQNYVDTIDKKKLEEDIISNMLKDLDPHSVYISKEEVTEANEDLEGSFSGIGVQFNIQNDTVMIVNVIAGGPSEKVGLFAGDRIVEVNDSSFVGKSITNRKVLKTLRGEKGSKVKIGIKRKGQHNVLYYTVTRGDIPIHSVDVAYKINPVTGYIKVSQFGANTYKEFLTALVSLRRQNCKNIIIDLRNNSGGYLSAVIQMTNEFLQADQLIVYTKGRKLPREDAPADGNGRFKNINVCVLINEWSASASEIFAGAIQDHDRGWIIGRRSFGKGLVQQQIPLRDGSELRLTVARYYTPSGRCIQKPYAKADEYEGEIQKRFLHGEFFQKDSTSFPDSLKFATDLGRPVYAKGGIMPDYFVGEDTSAYTTYYKKVMDLGIVYDFSFDYVDSNRKILSQYKTWQDLSAYLNTTHYFEDFIRFAEKKKIKRNGKQIAKSKKLLENTLQAFISRNVLGDSGFYPILNLQDEVINKALEVVETPIKK